MNFLIFTHKNCPQWTSDFSRNNSIFLGGGGLLSIRMEKPLKPIFHQHYYVNLICKNFPRGRYRHDFQSRSTHNNNSQLVKHKHKWKQKKNLHVNKVKNKLQTFWTVNFWNIHAQYTKRKFISLCNPSGLWINPLRLSNSDGTFCMASCAEKALSFVRTSPPNTILSGVSLSTCGTARWWILWSIVIMPK